MAGQTKGPPTHLVTAKHKEGRGYPGPVGVAWVWENDDGKPCFSIALSPGVTVTGDLMLGGFPKARSGSGGSGYAKPPTPDSRDQEAEEDYEVPFG